MNELLMLQAKLEARLIDQERRSKGANLRIHEIAEGPEDNSPTMVEFVKTVLKKKLQMLHTSDLCIDSTSSLGLEATAWQTSMIYCGQVHKFQGTKNVLKWTAEIRVSVSGEKSLCRPKLCPSCYQKTTGI